MRNSLKLLNLRKKLNAFHAILLYFTIIIFIFFTLLIGAFTHALPLTEYSSVEQTLSIHNNKNVMEYIKQGKDIPSDVNFPLYI